MRKIIIFMFLFFVAWSVSAQELIVVGGGGYDKKKDISKTAYGFIDSRLMINLTEQWRFGPYLGFVQYASVETYKKPTPSSSGKELEYGLSIDNYGPIGYSMSHYFWINTGFKSVKDNFKEGNYNSNARTNSWFFTGGFILTDDWQGWLGNNRLMWFYQKPVKEEVKATWQNTPLPNIQPYNKESFKLTLESGIKSFGERITFEPLIHLAYGQTFGNQQQYYDLGGGLSFGIFKEWNRDIIKLIVYERHFDGIKNNTQENIKKSLGGEAVFNLTAFIKALKK